MKTVEDEVKIDTAKLYKELESKAREEADKKAKEYVVTAIQKCAADHVAETTISVVQLPSDEMKGRIDVYKRQSRGWPVPEPLLEILNWC